MSITGKPRLNFTIYNTYEPELILVADYSDWKILENKPAIMKIIPPGSNREIIHTWKKNRVNIYNSINLGLSCLTECDEQKYEFLPDGIYQFILEGSPSNYNKKRYYLKTDQFRLDLDTIYIKLNIEYSQKDDKIKDLLSDIEFMLSSAEAFTRNGDFVRADRAFCEAKKILECCNKLL